MDKNCKILTLYIPQESFEDLELFKRLVPLIEKRKNPDLKIKNPKHLVSSAIRIYIHNYVEKYKKEIINNK